MYFFIVYFCGLWMFCFNYKHLLITLLSLEFIVLILYLMICFYLNLYNYELYFMLIFLTFSVCEGALGLSILVTMVRTYGNDYFQSFLVTQC
uniref:NADH-ubiquinone oxidoreductase chain 4L n=1 Tax=Tryonicus mackerrasae TaxID=2093453 RepID=A0A2P1H910_9NEOP|nr:NADH dehydrogenase subunit 4L [Tryonicus mackerrasae]